MKHRKAALSAPSRPQAGPQKKYFAGRTRPDPLPSKSGCATFGTRKMYELTQVLYCGILLRLLAKYHDRTSFNEYCEAQGAPRLKLCRQRSPGRSNRLQEAPGRACGLPLICANLRLSPTPLKMSADPSPARRRGRRRPDAGTPLP